MHIHGWLANYGFAVSKNYWVRLCSGVFRKVCAEIFQVVLINSRRFFCTQSKVKFLKW